MIKNCIIQFFLYICIIIKHNNNLKINHMKITMKEKVLRFVENQPNSSARHKQIIEFIVDTKFGDGTYARDAKSGSVTRYTKTGVYDIPANPWRGYYSSAFSGRRPYFIIGDDRLEKLPNGSYIVIRKK